MRFLNDEVVIDQNNGVPMMQVIGAGLPRCATSSQQTAFESQYIGLTPCMHFAHVAPHACRSDILLAAMRERDTTRRHKLLYELFDGFQATTDCPGSLFVDDLMNMYPNAKIVLNKYTSNLLYYIVYFLWKIDYNIETLWDLFLKRSKVTLGLTDDKLLTAKYYDAHNAWVHIQAAKRGLEVFEFEPWDGWEPLCAILSKEAPKDEPFPHRNDASEVRMIVRILYARGLISWFVLGGVIYGAARLLI
ncbi:hypothetical protein N7493_001210 [Penicillium malachiteum]|uniref:Uncharacterized protein n=1 Tax=Penicillium malachiteum TaxID=1324776 RepID=A0AAD6HTS9_9EURO|nr:hypothetical protein N7493_001210 [Penicillium malachiteum]